MFVVTLSEPCHARASSSASLFASCPAYVSTSQFLPQTTHWPLVLPSGAYGQPSVIRLNSREPKLPSPLVFT